jgi:hypothetical protein
MMRYDTEFYLLSSLRRENLYTPESFWQNACNSFVRNGRDDETPTRDFCRDSRTFVG